MEILAPTLLRTFFWIAVALTLASLLSLLFIIALRWLTDRRLQHTSRFRRNAGPLVSAYAETNTTNGSDTLAVLQADRQEARLLLLTLSAAAAPPERAKIATLFAGLNLVPDELSRLDSRRWETRMEAAQNLGYMGDDTAVPALRKTLHDEVLAVRLAAAYSLAALGRTETTSEIITAFDLPGEMNQRRVAEILMKFGPDGTQTLLAVAANTEGKYSDNAIGVAVRVLGLLHAQPAAKQLLPLLKHSEYRVRLNAARSLGLIGDAATAHEITPLVEDQTWEVRNAAVQALGRLKANQEATLVKALADHAWWVRFSAARALYALGDTGIRALKDAVAGNADGYARDISRQVLQENGLASFSETSL